MIEGERSDIKHLGNNQQRVQQRVGDQPQTFPQDNNKDLVKNQNQDENSRPCLWFCFSWLLFLAAFIIYVGVWAISSILKIQLASFYYQHTFGLSPYFNDSSQCIFPSVKSSAQLQLKNHESLKSIAFSLLLTWLMWKLAMVMFMLYIALQGTNKILKFVSFGVSVFILLAVDILLTIFQKKYYQQFMFYGLAAILAIIISILNHRTSKAVGFMIAFIPLLYIAILYVCYVYLIPELFGLIYNKLTQSYAYLTLYGYPIIDLIFYSALLAINAKSPLTAKPLLSFIQFFILGYFCGITLLASITQVEFYYLCAYMLFRNFFTNWVMWQWQKVTNNPPCLPGWILIYYLSYILNFLPLIGIGPLIVSDSFKSRQFSTASPLLSDATIDSGKTKQSHQKPDIINFPLLGCIFWGAAIIIWAISTFSQKYPRRKPTLFDLFYNLAGIYMFYIGISAGLELQVLSQVVFH